MANSFCFVSASQEQLPDAYDALASVVDIQAVVLARHSWPATTKRAQVASTILMQLRHTLTLARICVKQRNSTVLVCADNHYAALLAALITRPFKKNTKVYLLNFYLHELGKKSIVQRILRLLFTSKVALLVQAADEVAYFRNLSSQIDIALAPFAIPDRGEFSIPNISVDEMVLGEYVFAGGRSNRDHLTVIRAAAKLPGVPFVIAASKKYTIKEKLPPNVRLLEDVSSHEFHSLMAGSRCVVVSLKDNVGSSGQMVVLAAMQYGKLVLYSEMPSVSQYFGNDKSGVEFRTGDSEDLAEKLNEHYWNLSLCEIIGQTAREHVETHHSRRQYLNQMVSHLIVWTNRPSL